MHNDITQNNTVANSDEIAHNLIKLTQTHSLVRCHITEFIPRCFHLHIIVLNMLTIGQVLWNDSWFIVLFTRTNAFVAGLAQAMAMGFGFFKSFPFRLFWIELLSYFGAHVR